MDDYFAEDTPPKGKGFIKYFLGFIVTLGIIGALYGIVRFFLANPVVFIGCLIACAVAFVTYILANVLFGD